MVCSRQSWLGGDQRKAPDPFSLTPFPLNLVYVSHAELEITSEAQCREVLAATNASIVVNTAAYTAVDRAEDPGQAEFVELQNVTGPATLARICGEYDIPLVHFSTDHVFDGKRTTGAYVEDDSVNPINVYGRSKFAGEEHVRQNLEKHFIFRTSWLYSPFGKNMFQAVLRQVIDEGKDSLKFIDDQWGTPTFAADLARATLHAVEMYLRNLQPSLLGTYHLSNTGVTTWCGLVERFVQAGGFETRVEAISTSDFVLGAKRPAYSPMDCSKFQKSFDYKLPTWEMGVEACWELKNAMR